MTAFFLIACACLNVLFVICATRVNIVFMLIFFGAGLGFVLAAAARWCIAEGALVTAGRLVVVSFLPIELIIQSTDLRDVRLLTRSYFIRALELPGSLYVCSGGT